MVINDFNISGTSFCPSEADSPLPVYTDTVLSGSIALKRFKSITGRNSQIIEICGNFKLPQFPAGIFRDARKSLDRIALGESFGIRALEGSNHLRL